MATAILCVGMAFGDEGKGSCVDFLTRQHKAHTVVRFNGGAQAAHNVVTDDGRHHTFAQFGSGTFEGARTFLSRHMLVNPIAMLAEAKHLGTLGVANPLDLVTIDEEAVLTTPFHMAANRLREMRRNNARHGSCGMGIGETARLAETGKDMLTIRAKDLYKLVDLEQKLEVIQSYLEGELTFLDEMPQTDDVVRERALLEDERMIQDTVGWFANFRNNVTITGGEALDDLLRRGTTIFEGAQGVLLDRQYGFFPYVTRSHTTFKNALDLLSAFKGQTMKLGILRTYTTRHGAGPFPTEAPDLKFPEGHNRSDDPWQQNFRVGYFDFVMARYALDVLGGVDEIVMTHMDRLPMTPTVCSGYFQSPGVEVTRVNPVGIEGDETITKALLEARAVYETGGDRNGFLAEVERDLAPVTTLSFGPATKDKQRRSLIQNVA